jgi:hypothetical protein
VIPSAAIQAMPIVVATSSNRLPRSAWNRNSDMSPPAAATTPTVTAAVSDTRRSIGCPTAREHWSIAHAAAPNASVAQAVCTKSCQVNAGP